MPYAVRKKGTKFVVVVIHSGQVLGTHDSREKALRQIAAVEASEHAKGK